MADEVARVILALTEFAEKSVKALTLEVHAKLVRPSSQGGTPRDTGFASVSWIPTIGSPATGTGGTPDAIDSGAARSGLTQVATQYKLSDGSTFVSNNTNYIQKLNGGSSTQAPAGFVEKAVADAVAAVGRVAGRL